VLYRDIARRISLILPPNSFKISAYFAKTLLVKAQIFLCMNLGCVGDAIAAIALLAADFNSILDFISYRTLVIELN
jgi:hypothetical protein